MFSLYFRVIMFCLTVSLKNHRHRIFENFLLRGFISLLVVLRRLRVIRKMYLLMEFSLLELLEKQISPFRELFTLIQILSECRVLNVYKREKFPFYYVSSQLFRGEAVANKKLPVFI